MITYWHDDVICLCIVAELDILQQKCLNKWIRSAPLGTRFYNFQPPTLTVSPQTSHLLNS